MAHLDPSRSRRTGNGPSEIPVAFDFFFLHSKPHTGPLEGFIFGICMGQKAEGVGELKEVLVRHSLASAGWKSLQMLSTILFF